MILCDGILNRPRVRSIEVVFKELKMETMWSGPKTEAQDTSSFRGQEAELEQVDEAEKEQPAMPGGVGSWKQSEKSPSRIIICVL